MHTIKTIKLKFGEKPPENFTGAIENSNGEKRLYLNGTEVNFTTFELHYMLKYKKE